MCLLNVVRAQLTTTSHVPFARPKTRSSSEILVRVSKCGNLPLALLPELLPTIESPLSTVPDHALHRGRNCKQSKDVAKNSSLAEFKPLLCPLPIAQVRSLPGKYFEDRAEPSTHYRQLKTLITRHAITTTQGRSSHCFKYHINSASKNNPFC